MKSEVQKFCIAKGWYDTQVKFLESMALLHTEVCEMADAYEEHAMEPFVHEATGGPDGIAVELADVLIRALDDMGRYNLTIERMHYVYTATARVPNMLGELHKRIRDCTEAYRVHGIDPCEDGVGHKLSVVIAAVQRFAIVFNLDLEAAYHEKMAYNFKRMHRHGNKLA
jgi:hypothetical protein